MKKFIVAFFIAFQLSGLTVNAAPISSTGTTEVFFSPRGGCTEAIIEEISHTRNWLSWNT